MKFPRNWISWLASVLVISLTALSGVSSAGSMDVSNPLNLLQGKPIATNCGFQDGGIGKAVNGYGDYSHLGTGNSSWQSDNAQAITGLSGSAIVTIRVWCDPFTSVAPRVTGDPWYVHLRGMSGFSFKSSTTDWSSDPLGGTYETDLGDHVLPLAVTTGVLPTGWTSVGANDDPSWLFYYDITVNAPVGTKSLWFHMDAPSPTGGQYAQDLNEIQAFDSTVLPVDTTTVVSVLGTGTSTVGDSVTLKALIGPSGAAGTVQFHDNGPDTDIGGSITVSAGEATLPTTALTVGLHTITASFTGDTGFNNSESTGTATQTVLSKYDGWALQITNGNAGATQDADADGVPNFIEFAFNGNPMSAASTGMVYSSTEASGTYGDQKVLVLTIAVRAGTEDPHWTNNTATIDGITYTIEGGTTLGDFSSDVSRVEPFDTNAYVPASPDTGYEWRRFMLTGSANLYTKGFLRAKVEQ